MTTSTTPKVNLFRATFWQMTLMGLRYLGGRKLRTALTTLAIVFGVALIFAMNLVLPSMMNAFKQSMTTLSGADISITSVSGESFAPGPVMERLSSVQNVTAATGILRRQFNIPGIGVERLGNGTQLELIGLDPVSAQKVRQFPMSEGRFLQPDDSGKAVLPAGIVEFSPQVKVGTTFPLITAGGLKVYTIVGLLADKGNPSSPQIYVTLSDAQAAFNQPGLINNVEVFVDANADQEAVSNAIKQALGDNFQLNATGDPGGVLAAMQIGFAMFNLLGFLALFLGAFLIFNTFRTVVVERRHDLAMLRAVGATRGQITAMILIESLIQGLVGALIGLMFGYLLASGMTIFVKNFTSQYMSGANVQLQMSASAIGGAVVLGVAAALLAGFLPARSAGKTSPLEALRPATVASVHRAARWSLIVGIVLMVLAVFMLLSGSRGAVGGALLFLVGMVVAAPGLVIPAARLFSPLLTLWFAREGDLARGNLVRQPGRAAITGSTLMIGLATLIVIAALVTAMGDLITSLSNVSFSSDLILLPQSIAIYNTVIGADENLAARIKALPEVNAVGTLRYASGAYKGQSLQVMGIDPVEYRKVASLEFSQGNADEAFAALGSGRNAVLTAIALSSLQLTVGGDMVIQTAEGPQTYHVVGAAGDILTFKIAAVFLSQANMQADFHKSEDILLMANLKPGADKKAVLAKVQEIAKDYPQFTPRLTGEYRQEIAEYSSSALVLFYAVAILILIPAALGLLNTLTINVLERTREIGVVRAVGGSRTQVRRIVTGEALLLGTFGASMGVLAGVAMSYGFIAAFGSVGWKMPYTFPIMGIIAAVVVGVLLALFASVLPAHNAAKLDIIRALQYE
jgi:putative ABC transport system permease protein